MTSQQASAKGSSGPSTKGVSQEERASQKQQEQHRAQSKDGDNYEESLTTILTLAQRTQLTILLAAATAHMRDSLSATFDAKANMSSDMASIQQSSSSDRKEGEMTEDEKIMNPNIDPGTVDVAAHDKERKMLAAREKELSAPKMKELKGSALEWFDHWRERMIARVGEVLHQKKIAREKLGDEGAVAHRPKLKGKLDRKIDPEDSGPWESEGEGEKKQAEKAKPDAKTEDEEAHKLAQDALLELCPPVDTALAQLDESKRILILHSMLLILLSLEHYAAPSRILLLYLVTSLHLPVSALNEDEAKTAQGLLEAAKELSGKSETEKRTAENATARKWKVGLATVAGAAIVGVTGGLAAPLVAAGVGSVMGGLGLGATAAAGYLGSVAGSTLVVGGLFGAYGGRMTGQMMDAYAREVEDFGFIPVRHASGKHRLFGLPKSKEGEEEAGKQDAKNRRLRVTIGITGWLTSKEEVVSPWRVLDDTSEVFALRWELESLMNLGNAITAMVSSAAWGYAKKEIIAHSIFADMMAAMWPLGLLQIARVVDNPFSVAKSRAEKAGAVLADALQHRAQGERPVTLVGYSLGSRVIYACLLELAARKQFGLVESVVLIGSPIPAEAKDWRAMRSVVGGRLVNVFSSNDYVLGFLYRTSSIQLGVAGLQRVEGVMGVENVDVSGTVSGHLRYRYLVGSILKKIGFEGLDLIEVRREEEEFQQMLEEERKRAEEMKKKIPKNIPGRSKLGAGGEKAESKHSEQGAAAEQGGKKQDDDGSSAIQAAASAEAESMEAAVREQTRKSLMQRGLDWWHSSSTDAGKDGKVKPEGQAGAAEKQSSSSSPSSSSYLSYARSAIPSSLPHFGGAAKPSSDAVAADAAAEVSGAKDEKGQEQDKGKERRSVEEGRKSYLEMAAESGKGVGSSVGSA
ncbi:MAG: hypothetical protein LQ340_007819, partial [Diploschistes diacapsis]